MIENRDTRASILICVVLTLLVCAVFGRVAGHDFINFDDDVYVTDNEFVQKGLDSGNAVWAFSTFYASNWHPLTWLSHMLDCELFGLRAGGHHVTNLVLHILNTLFLFIVLRLMTGAVWRSAFAAALFAVHPLHVESVAWVAERKDVLSTVFWMLTIAAYYRYAKRPGTQSWLLVFILLALGLLAKPMLVSLPVILLLLDFWPLRRISFNDLKIRSSGSGPKLIRLVAEKLPLFLLAAASAVVTFFAQRHGGTVVSMGTYPLENRIANAVVSYALYLWKTLCPSRLAVFYPYKGYTLFSWQVILSVIILVAITVLVVRHRARFPYLVVGWFWYAVTLVPVIGLVQVGKQGMADRYTYIPLTGIFIIAVWGLADLIKKRRSIKTTIISAAICMCIAFSAAAFKQVSYWRDSETLFRHALSVTSVNNVAHMNLGDVLLEKGELNEALGHYREVLSIAPENPEVFYNIGIVSALMGKADDAEKSYTEAIRFDPDLTRAYNNLGVLLSETGRYSEAAERFKAALEQDPGNVETLVNLGVALKGLGRIEEAVERYEEALRKNPDYTKAYNNLGVALVGLGRFDDAIRSYSRAIELDPAYADACYNLANAFARRGNYDEAVTYYERALGEKYDLFGAHNNLAQILAFQGDAAGAAEHFEEALGLDPNVADTHYNLGVVLASLGNNEQAADHLREALRLRPDFTAAADKLRDVLK